MITLKHTLIPLFGLFLFSSCLKEDDNESIDLSAPKISANEGQTKIQPEYFFKTDANISELPLAFTIEDLSGIREIKIQSHSGFDGHTHGRLASPINPRFKLLNHNEIIDIEGFKDNKQFSYTSSIYLDDRNPKLESGDLILGGPYHFSIQATDIEGNETAYGDNTTYHTTLYLNKPYAPQVNFTGSDVSSNLIRGSIYRNMEHEASSSIVFLWIYIETPNIENPGQDGIILTEKIWGSSNWPHQFRSNEGETLPDNQLLDLSQLVGNDVDFLGSLANNKLVVWAEDSNGNISINKLNN